jgi:hypothetical protein
MHKHTHTHTGAHRHTRPPIVISFIVQAHLNIRLVPRHIRRSVSLLISACARTFRSTSTLSLSGRPQSAVSFRLQVPFRTQDIRVLPPLQLIYIFYPHFSPQLTSLLLSKALRSKTARESCGPDQALAPLLICPAESKPPKGLWKRWVWYVSLSTCCVLHAEAVKPLLNPAQL